MTDFFLVDRFSQAIEEANVDAQTFFDLLSQLLTDMAVVRQAAEAKVATLGTQILTLLEEQRTLLSSLMDLNGTHN